MKYNGTSTPAFRDSNDSGETSSPILKLAGGGTIGGNDIYRKESPIQFCNFRSDV